MEVIATPSVYIVYHNIVLYAKKLRPIRLSVSRELNHKRGVMSNDFSYELIFMRAVFLY